MKETDLAKPVADWLRSKGYTVYAEVPWLSRCIDFVGLRDSELIIVELKMSLTQKAEYQARTGQLITNQTFIAVGTKPKKQSIENCRKAGLGILSVKSTLHIVLKPTKQITSTFYQRRMIQKLSGLEPSDEAGKPNQKGCGPAQYCLVQIKKYIDKHPSAKWREIYKNVPNHYSNYQSMQSAMSGYLGFSLQEYKRGLFGSATGEKGK